MFIADAQVHIWGENTPERPWPTGTQFPPQRPVPLGADELLGEMDEAGISRAVLVPPSWEGNRNDLVIDATRRYPERFSAMARVNLRATSHTPLSELTAEPGIRGVRVMFALPDQRTWFADGTADWLFEQAEAASLPVMIFAPGLTDALATTARQHPGLRLIIDHLNLGLTIRNEAIAPTVEPLLDLAAIPNVAVKISALPCHVDDSYPFASLHPTIERVVNAFGADRCMWGSDFSRLTCPYSDWARVLTEAVTFLSEQEKAQIMAGTLASWLDWPLP